MKSLQDISIQFIKGVGPARKKLFQNLGVETVEDLLYLFPRRYEDRTRITPVINAKVGEWQTITGEVLVGGGRKTWLTKKHIFEIVVGDDSGRIFCVWFNQPYLDRYFQVGTRVVLYGKVDVYKNRIQMVSPEYEIIDDDDASLNTGRIVPIYPLTRGMSQRYLRKIMRTCLDRFKGEMPDLLSHDVRHRQSLLDMPTSIEQIHFPDTLAMQESAHQRISFEEFFFFQISVILRRLHITRKKGIAHQVNPKLIEEYQRAFPFPLTGAQKNVLREMTEDLKKPVPMLRLLQGDVGSGKTVAAFFGCVVAYANGYQSAIMAPTEILAQQHFLNFQKIVENAPFKKIRVALLTSGLSKKEREALYGKIQEGRIDVIIGTHALLQGDVQFKALSFAVIDEQHKFGVKQRALLSAKGQNPDILVMTATPIPRTLCLTLYGDLDVSVIDEMPPGRGRIQTYLFSSDQADGVYAKVRDWVKKGTQAYIVYPLIEESEKTDLKAAETMYRHFQEFEFKGLRLGLVHGQMDREETLRTMAQFKDGAIDILVTTTVLEVGIDVPNANVMVIEHAERFGLSQLHQLRGRIGRGPKNAVCMLLGDPVTEDARARLEAIVSTLDGFKIAQQDLAIRGPGQYFGRHQHGLNELKVVNPATQLDILERARQEAVRLTNQDPRLETPDSRVIKEVIRKRYPEYLSLVLAG